MCHPNPRNVFSILVTELSSPMYPLSQGLSLTFWVPDLSPWYFFIALNPIIIFVLTYLFNVCLTKLKVLVGQAYSQLYPSIWYVVCTP